MNFTVIAAVSILAAVLAIALLRSAASGWLWKPWLSNLSNYGGTAMPIGNKELLNLTVLTVIAITGCNSNERLAELAQHDLETQHAQNETIARQSSAVVAESHQLAVAAKDLVSQDAKARQELIAAQHDLHGQLHEERTGSIESANPGRRARDCQSAPARPGNRRSHSGSRSVAGLLNAAVTRGLCA